MTNQWAKRTRLFADDTIEKRLEQITLTCLEVVVNDLNDQLDAKDKTLNKIDAQSISPDPARHGAKPPRGLYPLVKLTITRALIHRAEELDLDKRDVARLTRIEQVMRKRISANDEMALAMAMNPQLTDIFESPNALMKGVANSLYPALQEYLQNKPDRSQGQRRLEGPAR